MAYTNLTNEQAAKLATNLGPEFTASAKNDLLNFADAIVGLVKPAKVEAKAQAVPEAQAEKPKAVTKQVK